MFHVQVPEYHLSAQKTYFLEFHPLLIEVIIYAQVPRVHYRLGGRFHEIRKEHDTWEGTICFPAQRNNKFPFMALLTTLHFLKFLTASEPDRPLSTIPYIHWTVSTVPQSAKCYDVRQYKIILPWPNSSWIDVDVEGGRGNFGTFEPCENY